MHAFFPLAPAASAAKARCAEALELLRRLGRFAGAHEPALFWGLAVFYRISLDLLCCFAAYPVGGYMIAELASSALRYAVSFVLYLLLFAAMPKREEDGIVLAVHLQFAFTVAPVLTLYAFSNGSGRYVLMVSLCVLLESFVVFRPLRVSRPVRIKGVQSYMTVMLGILTVFALVVPMLYNGFAGLKAFSLSYIYEMRANAAYPPGFGYLLAWVTKAFLPFGFLCFLHLKKYRWAALAAAMQVIFYMQTGQKITLLILFPMVFIYFCVKTGHCLKLMYLGLGAGYLATVLLCQLDRLAPEGTPLSLRVGTMAASQIAVRALFIPAGIKFAFYDCFSTHPKLFFSDGQLGRMFGMTYPYKMSSGFVVNAFQGDSFGSANANTGYLGESYAQMGFAGMLLMSLLLALILRSLRVYSRKDFAPLLTALLAIYIIFLNDISLFTNLVTGGMLVTYFLIFIYFDTVAKGADNGIHRL